MIKVTERMMSRRLRSRRFASGNKTSIGCGSPSEVDSTNDSLASSAWGAWITAIDATIGVLMTPVKPPDYDESGLNLEAVDRSGTVDLHDQVAAEIRRAIADGEARPGEQIPQAKDLAAVLGVHTNTVLRALRLLRDEGLLEVGRGRAITVAGTPERGGGGAKLEEVIDLARRNGYRREELVEMLQTFPG